MGINSIYLAGSVPKSDDDLKKIKDWRIDFIEELNKIKNFKYINPREIRVTEEDTQGVFGLDCDLIKNSDLLIVYIFDRSGIGTSQEILIAKYFKKPVILVIPKNTHHRIENLVYDNKTIKDWIHPFLDQTCDIIIEDKSELRNAIKKLENTKIKDITIIDESIDYYKEKYTSNILKITPNNSK